MTAVFLLMSALLPLYSPVPYIRSILRGQTKPHRTTRLVYLAIGVLTTTSLLVAHDRVGIWISAVSTLQAIVLFVLGLRYGMGGWSKTDLVCLLLALVGIAAWRTTSDPLWGLYFGILADFSGTIPTVTKTLRLPQTEEPQFYIIDAVAAGFNLLAVPEWTLGAVSYPMYLLLINALVAFLILRSPRSSLISPQLLRGQQH